MAQDIVITGAVRTAIGRVGGTLKVASPIELATCVMREVLARASVSSECVDQVVLGQAVQTEPNDLYLARMAALNAGVAQTAPAHSVNRMGGSGLESIVSAARAIKLGEARTVVTGGVECMSRAPFIVRGMCLHDDEALMDMMMGALSDPFHRHPMWATARSVAEQHGIDIAEQMRFAQESHRRAAHAIGEGRFAEQIVPVSLPTGCPSTLFAVDELPVNEDDEHLPSSHVSTRRSLTARHAPQAGDAAAALVLMDGKVAEASDVRPLARLASWAHSSADPAVIGAGAASAASMALVRAGIAACDVDVIEVNETFAAQAHVLAQTLGIDPEKPNPNGSAVALGHPVGAAGALLAVKAVHELHRSGGRHALVTLSVGDGQGIAAVFERL
jgi:acetyl-CoA C-acetyltransferase